MDFLHSIQKVYQYMVQGYIHAYCFITDTVGLYKLNYVYYVFWRQYACKEQQI